INVGEALPGVGTPMTWSVLRAFSRRGFETAFGALGLEVPERYALVGSFYGRVYLNLTEFASIITQIPVMRPETLLEVAGGPAIDQIRGNYDEHSSRHFLSRLPLTVPRIVLSQVSMPLIGHHWANVLRRRSDAFLREDLARLSRNALEARMASVDRWFTWTGLVMLACSSNFLSSYVVTRELLARWGGSRAATRENRLFSGLTGLRSAEPGLELLRMARHVRSQPHLEAWLRSQPPATLAKDLDAMVAFPGGFGLRQQLHHFLREYGHRAPREAELATPRWREDPTFVLEVLRTYLEAPHMPDPDQLARDREEARQETTEAIRRHFTTGLGLIFRQFLRLSQHNARLREDLRDCVVETLTMYRHLFLEVGRRLVGRGVVSTADDIFFLTQDEVREVLQGSPTDDLGVRVALRRAEYNAFQNTPDPPETFTLSRGRIHSTEPETPGPKDELHGLPGSSGRVTARARVILDPTAPDAQLHPGEILVAPLTDVGWTPLFLAASGVVMDKGGPLSHSCIVAREYGIPAVVNVKRGTALIQTGDLITLDGDRGVVYLPHRAEP
ncbi:MAG: PEP-utilizing enzyme, partial [Myxococcota bacterium]